MDAVFRLIITQMQEHGSDYSDVLLKAQELGYAEADPTLDVNGSDTAQKLAILAQLAFELHVDWETIPRKGVDELALQDIQMADALGYRIKLLATAAIGESEPVLSVSPTLVCRMRLWSAGDEKVSAPSVEDASVRWFVRVPGEFTCESLAEAIVVDTGSVCECDAGVGAISEPCTRREIQTRLGNLSDSVTILPVL